MSAISRAQLAKELEPGLNALFGLEYARYDDEASGASYRRARRGAPARAGGRGGSGDGASGVPRGKGQGAGHAGGASGAPRGG